MVEPRVLASQSAILIAVAVLASAPASGLAQASDPPSATAGADLLVGGPGPDTLEGLAGDDTLLGLDGPDVLNGNAGDDMVDGGPGDDWVNGGQGRDVLNGGSGNDTLAGDRDNDTLTGGPGADWFVLTVDGGDDLVTDFSSAAGDRIVLPTGASPQLLDDGQGLIVRLPGASLRLAGVSMATLGDWRAGASAEELPRPVRLPPAVGTSSTSRARGLQVVIVLLALLFVGLLARGLTELVRDRPRR